MRRAKSINLAKAQAGALAATTAYLDAHLIPVSQAVSDAEYAQLMEAVMRAMGQMYAQGYEAGIARTHHD